MRRKHFKDDDETQVDMTPMLDIVFIMLIFFIVTTSFVKESGVAIDRPDPNQEPPPPEEKKKKNIFVKIDAANRISMDGLDVDIRAVRARVEQKRAQNPEAIAIIGVDESSETDILISVVNAARMAGVDKVTVSVTEL
ncbi:MAG: biopolymer transporter ExbD [Gammaproteobacteria bacterium]|nr:biopolymer transporter ExbD [Gammaproteobacteria bacterium]